MGIEPSKISVLYPGIGTRFRRVEDQHVLAQVRAHYRLPERFLLHVGTIEPRKNLERLMAAFAQVRARQPDAGLVLAGKPGWLADPILQTAHETPGVLLTGPVADADLPAMYTLATGLIYPTLYEGFGFPPLEALACGTPAAASSASSLPELAGDAMALFDPLDTAAIAHAVERMLDDPQVAERARTAGPAQAAQFSWQQAAQRLHTIYRICMEEDRTIR
jgi:glycosyltransferase involved in cell wall biosynthesis